MLGLDVVLKANFGKFSRKSRIIICETFLKETYFFNIVSLLTIGEYTLRSTLQ